MSPRAWKNCVGIYKGTIHSAAFAHTDIGGATFGTLDVELESAQPPGVTVAEVRLDLSGTPDCPLVYLEMDSSATSEWVPSGTYFEKYTNIPHRKYGVRYGVLAYSHAPNQLLISLKPDLFSPNRGAAMILTFRGRGVVDIEYIGHFSRRGNGNLSRVPGF